MSKFSGTTISPGRSSAAVRLASDTETIAGITVTKAVTPAGLHESFPFVLGQSTGARHDVESGVVFQQVVDANLYVDPTTPLVRKVSLTAGNYPTNTALNAPDPVVYEGESSFGTRVQVGASFPPGGTVFNFEYVAGISKLYGDELHVPGYGLRHLGIHGNDRIRLAHGVEMAMSDRSQFIDVLFRWMKGSAFRSSDSLRESKFWGVDFWGCGSAGNPALDLYQTTTTDGHNLNRFIDCRWFSVGDHVRIGSTTSAVVRSTMFTNCTFHGIPEVYDGFGDTLDTTFTDPVLFDDEGNMPCRIVVENARGVEFIGCDWIAPGRGQPNILISEGLLGSAAINHVHIMGGVMKNRPAFYPRFVSAVDTALDTISTLEYGVPTLERHHMSTGSRIQFDGGSLPAPLVVTTDYFVIRVDERYFKLATTRANAVAGTAINLTTAGGPSATIYYSQKDQYVGSIDTATEIITSVDHRMADEACIRFGTDGGSLPTGITASTDYFVKRVDKDSFKVSTSRPLLRAGTFVNITAAGSSVYWIPQVIHIDIERGQLTLDGGTVFEDFPRAVIKLRDVAAFVKVDSSSISTSPAIPLIEDSTGAVDTQVTQITGAIRMMQNNNVLYGTTSTGTATPLARVSTANVNHFGDFMGLGTNTQMFGNTITDLVVGATTRVRAHAAGASVTGWLGVSQYEEFTEMAAPAAGAANTGRLFLVDNGAGKTVAKIQFNTGAAQVIATEP